MKRRFNVVVVRADGGVEVHPLKEWLRLHPEQLPPGMDATRSTSHQLQHALRKRGWSVEELPNEVRLMLPGDAAHVVVDAVLGAAEEEAEGDVGVAFGLEAQLRDFIAHNLARITVGGRSLSLYTDAAGRGGIEYPTDVGSIDILARDQDGSFVVFELKLDRGPDRTLGQLARYMGWVKLRLAGGGPVNGVIVARQIDERLRYAASVIQNVSLLEYEIDFRLREAAAVGATPETAG